MAIDDVLTIPIAIHCMNPDYKSSNKNTIQAILDEFPNNSVAVTYCNSSLNKRELNLYVKSKNVINSPEIISKSQKYHILNPNELGIKEDKVNIILMGGESNLEQYDWNDKRSWGCHKCACDELVNWFYEESNLKNMKIIVPFNAIFSAFSPNLNTEKYRGYFKKIYTYDKASFEIIDNEAILELSK